LDGCPGAKLGKKKNAELHPIPKFTKIASSLRTPVRKLPGAMAFDDSLSGDSAVWGNVPKKRSDDLTNLQGLGLIKHVNGIHKAGRHGLAGDYQRLGTSPTVEEANTVHQLTRGNTTGGKQNRFARG
jgi:hypothetical protein